ncbi:mannonate dehydratase [Luteolibacter arcticus]|uniref:mannonate dehydratase n=1 Tax=Luteolibacter arcticus TaxID=1581411 RepID=A0ABT3GI25_9BACT|nr:mannonate dehydratase [Luteolibacter arcticus]MCW1923151.1 mannonate dehydratase [Luteolibacter arcticus]
MKLGFGLYRHQLDADHFRFATQCGASHLVVHWVDYFRSSRDNQPGDQPIGNDSGWGLAGDPDKLWSFEELSAVKEEAASHGLQIEAIENFDPAHWHDVLLDGPKKLEQFEKLKTIIRTVGRVGIPTIGYNFSIAGVAGRIKGPTARGGAEAVGMENPYDTPIPNGMVWNMVYDRHAPPGNLLTITPEELWQRHGEFLDVLMPVAEEAGVTLALHPDDPPTPTLRGQPRLVNQPHLYQRAIDRHSSTRNALEFCLGTLAEMTDGDLYEAVDNYSRQNRVAYVHFRNVRGKVPHYCETFVDEGDIDMLRVLRILKGNGFEGVLIPDHAPQMTCAAPWHSGMAFACGWMKAALQSVENDR